MLIIVFILGSCVVVRSDQDHPTVTIPPGNALQDYLCNGTRQSNITVVLGDGEHRISSERSCIVSNKSGITITGSPTQAITIRCEGEGKAFVFLSIQMLTMERITFFNCGIKLISIENTFILNCTFLKSSNGAISSKSSYNTWIASCAFSDTDGGALMLVRSTGSVAITKCTFQNCYNSANDFAGAVSLWGSTGNALITDCTFQNNSASYAGGAVELYRQSGNVSITTSTFHINNAQIGAIHIKEMSSYLFISVSSFTNNTSQAGAAMYAINNDIDSYNSLTTGHIILQDVIVKGHHCSSDKCAGTIYFRGVTMEIIGSTITGSNFVSNSPQGAIEGENGVLLLQGYITFANNTGENGGAIHLSNNVPVYFYDNCKVDFFQNVATK